MAETDLTDILQTLESSPDNSTCFDAGWSQGRSAYGGLSAAFAVTGMRKLVQPPRPLRSLMVSFIAPLPPGEARVEARIQRQGRNVVQASAGVLSGDTLCLQVMAAFGNPREGLRVEPVEKFDAPRRDQGVAFADYEARKPPFLRYFEGCWLEGMPWSGQASRRLRLWARTRADMSTLPAEKIVVLADIPPPLVLSHFDRPSGPASSVSWSLEFLATPESIDSEWFYLEFVLDAAADGYTVQSGSIFDEHGRLCAMSRQCMVYFDRAARKPAQAISET